jgi:hypothetical protein
MCYKIKSIHYKSKSHMGKKGSQYRSLVFRVILIYFQLGIWQAQIVSRALK